MRTATQKIANSGDRTNGLPRRKAANNNGWTPERRARQAEKIRSWQPWTRSTGPRTVRGKLVCSRNGWKHGARSQAMRSLRAALRLQRRYMTAWIAERRGNPVPMQIFWTVVSCLKTQAVPATVRHLLHSARE